jgi:hypothetical protein
MGGMIGGASQILQGMNNEEAAGSAGRAQSNWNWQGINSIKDTYAKNSANYDPYIQGGAEAEEQLRSGMGPNGSLGRSFTMADYQADPAYQFTRQQGLQAIGNSNSVRGGSQSGGTAKALANYALEMANNSFGQSAQRFGQAQDRNFSQLSHVAGTGLQATQGLGQLGSDYTRQLNPAYVNQGNAEAGSIIGQAMGRNQQIGGFAQMGQSAASMGMGGGSGSAGMMSSLGMMGS